MTAGSYTVELGTTEGVPPQERADFWSELVRPKQASMNHSFPRTDDFLGMNEVQRTKSYQLSSWTSDPMTYTRTQRQVRQDPDEDYRFMLPLVGHVDLRQDDQTVRILPGMSTLTTFTEPFECAHVSLRAYIMTVPAREINDSLDRKSPMAAGLALTTGLGRVVSDMLNGIHEERHTLTAVQFDALSSRVVELLCMLAVGDDRPTATSHLAEVEAMVRRYVRHHACDPELSGEKLARDLGWSLRQVQLALQQAGTTPRELIREERLRWVRDQLQNPMAQHRTIADLAHAAGFSSLTAFSSAFRRRFGMCARDMRYEQGR